MSALSKSRSHWQLFSHLSPRPNAILETVQTLVDHPALLGAFSPVVLPVGSPFTSSQVDDHELAPREVWEEPVLYADCDEAVRAGRRVVLLSR